MDNFPERLRFFAGVVAGASLLAAVLTALEGPAPPLLPLVLLCALVVFAENRAVRLPNGTLVGGSFMVVMAAIVVFEREGAPLGALLAGLSTSLFYLPHFRRGARGWLAFNGGIVGLSTLTAAGVYDLLVPPSGAGLPRALGVTVCTALTFVAVTWLFLLASFLIDGTRSVREVLEDLVPTTGQILPFALFGVFLGRLYLDLGAPIVVLLVAPVLAAREVFASYLALKEAHEATMSVLTRALEAKDRYTAGHAERVARYARYIGEEMRFTPWRLERLRNAALMHDIGKLVVPSHLLNKPGKLTAEEFARVRSHEPASVEMLSRIDFLAPVAPTLNEHHFDPEHAPATIEPYIIAVADAYDAMTSTRSYRKALPQEVAFAELREKAGEQFHPECVAALLRALERRRERHGAGFEEATVEWQVAPPDAGVGSAGLGDLAPGDGRAPRDELASGDEATAGATP